ncbi:MAG: hypothetical protein IT168_19675 [Bryobacterales bacterium]|nr:hypothetical protein [Bryobacterales bacterium]
MLFLNPPYYVIDGHTLLSDHADPTLFYAIPPTPALALNAAGLPEFSLVQFLGGADAKRMDGGLLNLTVELPITDDTLARLSSRLKAKLNAPGNIRVIPVLFDDGVVELVALGATSGSPAAPAADGSVAPSTAPPPPKGPFSVQFLGSGRPALAGTNRATFQLVLDAPAAELVERTLELPDLPVVAIYRLGFAGLRPSFQIDVKADWTKLYRNLENKFKANVYYVTADAELKVSEALEQSGIRIDTTVFGVGDNARAAADRARKQLLDWIFDRLFQAMVDPGAATANAIGQVIDDTVSSLVRAVIPGVSYKLRAVQESQLRTMSARMNESVAERREVVPQGTLGGLLQRFRVTRDNTPNPNWPAVRNQLVSKVNLDGFPRIQVQVGVEDRFASDGISKIDVELSRINSSGARTNTKAVTFRTAAERESYAVNLLGEVDPRLATPYQYRTTVNFDPASRFGFHDPLSTNWTDARTTELYVEPRGPETYQLRAVQVAVTPVFSFAVFPIVTVELKAGQDNTATLQAARVTLNQEKPQNEWRYRSFGPSLLPYRYRATFHRLADRGGDIQTDWIEQTEDWLSVPDPLPRKRTINVFVNLPWQDIAASFIQLRYNDDPNDIHYDEQIDLDPAKRVIRRDIPIANTGSRAVQYRLTIFLASGVLMEGSWRETEDERVLVDRRLVDTRLVRVQSVGGKLRDNRLAQVRLRLQVREPGREVVRTETELRVQADQNDQRFPSWEYLLGDPPVRTVHYDALFIDENGFTDTVPFRPTEADLLVVNLRSKTVTV